MAFVTVRPFLIDSALRFASAASRRRQLIHQAPPLRSFHRHTHMSSSTSEADAAKRVEELRGPENIFSKILSKDIPADIVYENDECLAFRDISPQAPVHIVLIPKRRIVMLSDATDEDAPLLGRLMLAANEIARAEKLDAGYRVLVNNGYDGLQSVGHLHLHIIGGRKLKWGPF